MGRWKRKLLAVAQNSRHFTSGRCYDVNIVTRCPPPMLREVGRCQAHSTKHACQEALKSNIVSEIRSKLTPIAGLQQFQRSVSYVAKRRGLAEKLRQKSLPDWRT